MSISFETVDPNSRASQIFIELRGVRRSVAGSLLPPIGIFPGQYDQSLISGITDFVPVQVMTADEVGEKAGFGFEAHRQALWLFGLLGGFHENMWWVPIPEPAAAVVATGTIIFATNTTSSGTYFFSIGGDLLSFGVPDEATPTEVGELLDTAIAANLNGLVTSNNVTGTVTLTSKTLGVNGNEIKLVFNPGGVVQEAQNPAGMTVAVPGSGGYLTSGADVTLLHDMFFDSSEAEILGDRFYTCIAGPYTDAANIAHYENSWDARAAADIRRRFDSFFGYVKEVYASALAIAPTINAEGVSPFWDPRSFSPHWELQAAVMGLVMWSTTFDPGRPFKTLQTGIPFDTFTGNLSYSRNDALFKSGMGYLNNIAGELAIGDLALSYRLNGVGAATAEWFDSVSQHRRQQFVVDIENLFKAEPYTRGMVADDDSVTAKAYVIKPKQIIADMFALLDFWDSEGWIKNVATIKESVAAEINATNQSRLDSEVTLDEAQALRIVANLVKFLF